MSEETETETDTTPDPLQALHDEIVAYQRELKVSLQKSDPTPRAVATAVEGTVLSFLKEIVAQMATIREETIAYVDDAIAELAEGTQIEPEHAGIILELVEGTRLLIEQVQKSAGLGEDARKSLVALASKADEVERIVLDHSLDDGEGEEGEDGEEDGEDEDDEPN